MGAMVLNRAGELKGHAFAELIARPANAREALEVLLEFGAFQGNRYVVRPDLQPGDYALRVLPAAAALGDGSEWALADVMAAGERFTDVEAIDLDTNAAADPDLAFEDDGAVVPFQYDEMVTAIVQSSPQTMMNRRSVARRFPPEFTENPAYHAARWSHFAACAPRDLPDDLVDGWLRLAGRPKIEGGMSVSDIEAAIRDFRRKRDAEAQAAARQLTAVPKPGGDGGDAGGRTVLDPTSATLVVGPQLQSLVRANLTCDLEDDELGELARKIVRWLYFAAPREVVRSALDYDGEDWD